LLKEGWFMKHSNIYQKSYLLFFSFIFITLGILFIIKLNLKEVLATKYFYDSNKILEIMKLDSNINDKAFDFAANFYNFFNVFNIYDWSLWAIVLNFLTIIITLLYIFVERIPKINLLLIFWLLASFFLLQVYVTHVSKEWITFIFTLLLVTILKTFENKRLFFVLGFAIFIYTYFFRTYFGLVFLYFCIFFLFFNYKKSRIWIILLLILGLFTIPNKYLFDIFYIRHDLNLFRMDSIDAQTMILDIFISNNNFIMFFNYLLNSFRILIPLEIIFISFDIKYVAFTLYILFNSYIIFCNLKNYKKLSNKQQNVLILLLSIIFVHSIFEPDFGSYIRHFVSYFFVIYFNVLTHISLNSNK
jgi:hypothetical protein